MRLTCDRFWMFGPRHNTVTVRRPVSRTGLPLRVAIVALSLLVATSAAQQAREVGHRLVEKVQAFGNWDWPVYLGDQGRTQFSPLAQINATNVHRLRPVWEFRSGDATERSTMYSNPLVVDGVLYAVTPSLNAVALDAATGERKWLFDPSVHNDGTVIRQRESRRYVLEGRSGRADLPFRQGPSLRAQCTHG